MRLNNWANSSGWIAEWITSVYTIALLWRDPQLAFYLFPRSPFSLILMRLRRVKSARSEELRTRVSIARIGAALIRSNGRVLRKRSWTNWNQCARAIEEYILYYVAWWFCIFWNVIVECILRRWNWLWILFDFVEDYKYIGRIFGGIFNKIKEDHEYTKGIHIYMDIRRRIEFVANCCRKIYIYIQLR